MADTVTIVYTEVESANIEVTEEEAYVIETPATQGVTGPTGPTGAPGAVWYSGSGVPSDALLGIDGDWYINDLNGDTYNKIGGVWSLELNIKGTVDVIASANITDNSIVRGDGGLKGVQDSNLIVDDTGNITPLVDNNSELGSTSYTFKDAHFTDEDGTYFSARELAYLHRTYSECGAILDYTVSSSVSSSVWTITLTADNDANLLAFVFDNVTYFSSSSTMTVNATSFAGTDSSPNTVYVYAEESSGSVVLTASNTSPEGLVDHAHVANYVAGTVSTSDVTIYCKAESVVQMGSIATKVYHSRFLDGAIYLDGMAVTATQSDLTIASGNYYLIFETVATVSRTISTDGLFYIDNDGTYHTLTSFAFPNYSTGETISANRYYNVILGVTQNGTTNVHAIVQAGDLGSEYTNLADAIADENNTIRTVPRAETLRGTFIPVARIIVKNDANDYLQEFPSGNYYTDIRTESVSGGGGSGGTTSPLTTKGDIYTYSTTDERLAVGTDTYVLTADSTEATGLKWAVSTAGFSDPTTTRGDLIYKDSTATTTRLGAGTVGQVLMSDGTDISWNDAGYLPLTGGTLTGDLDVDATLNVTSTPGIKELIAKFTVADAASSYLSIENGSSTAGAFLPTIIGYNGDDARTGLFNQAYVDDIQHSGRYYPAVNFNAVDKTGSSLSQAPIVAFGTNLNIKLTTWFDGSTKIGGTQRSSASGTALTKPTTMLDVINSTSEDLLNLLDGSVSKFYVDVDGNLTLAGTVDGIDISTAVPLNTAKVSNATHTGEVTGATALTIADNIIDEANLKLPAGPTNDYVLTADSAQTGGMKWAVGGSGGATDKIEEGNSSVEVVDTGTGYVKTTVDGNEVVRVAPSTLRVGDGLDQSYSGDIFMVNDGGACVFGGRSFSTSALSAPRFEFGRVGGSLTTPASVNEGDRIGALNTLNYAGTGFQYTGGIFFINDGAPSGGVGPTKIVFETGTTNTASRTGRLVIRADGCVEPGGDDTQDFGSSSKRWDDIYATNATIQTSDERMKRDIVDTTFGLDFIIALTPKIFKWNDYDDEGYKDVEQYDKHGKLLGTKKEHYKHEHKHLRKHHGLMAQDVEKVVKDLGKGNTDFAGIIYDKENDRYGLRYNEFIAPLIKSVQELSCKNDKLEDRVEALEKLVRKLLKTKGGK